ncbi:MAG: hypothetical protein IH840_07775 [Candidatus Heimdallarchaeota archaeon]|nr:hypothetical protein [Candidatus Heimdallarchaeota archaeon]
MTFEIVSYTPDMIKKQVDLLWEITDQWDYPFGTSYASVEKQYSSKNFDPTTRFYAVEDGKLLGYITSATVTDLENGDYATSRFPMSISENPEIADRLMDSVVNRLRELGMQHIEAYAGPGMGNTEQMAKKYGFTRKFTRFKRSKITIDDLKVSGNIAGVRNYNDIADREAIKEIFVSKIGLTYEEGLNRYNSVVEAKHRKEVIDPNRVSWKVAEDSNGITAFSYFHRSDRNPSTCVFSPIWSREDVDQSQITDNILSAQIETLKPHGLKTVTSFLPPRSLDLDKFYVKFGFTFAPTYVYEKIIS